MFAVDKHFEAAEGNSRGSFRFHLKVVLTDFNMDLGVISGFNSDKAKQFFFIVL